MILDKKIQNFITENLQISISDLLLKKPIFKEISNKYLAQQIIGRNVASKKFPFLNQPDIIFPPQLNLEQASSQQTAEFKATGMFGKRFLDLTCGLGIDAFFLSQNFEEVHLVEKNPELLTLVKHNWLVLNRKASFHQQSLDEFLEKNSIFFDLIFIDPARRDENNKKKFLLEDLSPNLLEIQSALWEITNQILIKLSPLIDLKYLLSTLYNIERIDIVAMKNEVKEVVILQNRDKTNKKTLCRCINLDTNEPIFSFFFEDVESAVASFSESQGYIYIPNNTLLKSGAFNLISEHFSLKKLHPNTHLYTSDQVNTNFPGRILKSEVISAKNIKKDDRYNVISKNYPLSVDEIKKKYKIKDGSDKYLIFTQSVKGKEIILGKPV
ncbi:class I SAM-dependent methyltransferase [Capnocytophaga cynodegmi]|uniref:class I SAM-dependent methyltransferase n=1 Tax=Capnocytophaga cynodegmi TaxID=28189 RepID=UPI003858B782